MDIGVTESTGVDLHHHLIGSSFRGFPLLYFPLAIYGGYNRSFHIAFVLLKNRKRVLAMDAFIGDRIHTDHGGKRLPGSLGQDGRGQCCGRGFEK
jgi:hypothetical protein